MIDMVEGSVRVRTETAAGEPTTLISQYLPLGEALRLAASYKATGHDVSVSLSGARTAIFSGDVRAVITPLQRKGVAFFIPSTM